MGRPFCSLAAVAVLLLCPGRASAAEPDALGWVSHDVLPPLTLSFVGDIMHHRLNAEMPDYDRLYDSPRHLLQVDDLSFANTEFPVDPEREPAGYPLFNGTVAYVEAAIRAGFDVFSLANNHTYDLGRTGVAATRRVFADLQSRARIVVNGIRAVAGAPLEVSAIGIRGWRVGFIAITAFSNAAGAGPHVHLVDYLRADDRAGFLAQVSAWSREYDLLVVSVHAGAEYVTEPVDHKASFLRDISDAGAHIVWCHHSHVLQPTERRGNRLIIHSAGNFVSAQRRHQSPYLPFGRWAPTGDTAVFQVRVERRADGPAVSALRTPPFTMHDDPVHGLVLRTFEEVLASETNTSWLDFYRERSRVMADFAATASFHPPRLTMPE
ncbi:MAG: CapA family protein [Spirochaetota bacterium]